MWYRAVAVVVIGLVPTLAQAQSMPLRYHWTKGHVLTYEVEQSTKAVSTLGEEKFTSTNEMKLVKQWTVLDVDEQQVATVQLKLLRMRINASGTSNEPIIYDSSDPKKSDPQLKKQLSQYVGVPLALLRINTQGAVVEVRESKFGPASRFEQKLPFICELPAGAVAAGTKWKRTYEIVLEPPHGTGEKYPAEQRYTCSSMKDGVAHVAIVTDIKTMPEALLDRMPLMQAKPQGTVHFDVKNGRFLGAELVVKELLKSNREAGSEVDSYEFQSTYSERLVSHK